MSVTGIYRQLRERYRGLAKESLLKEPKTDTTAEGEKHRSCDHAIHKCKKCKMVDWVLADQPV
jgi:hypothetical protein